MLPARSILTFQQGSRCIHEHIQMCYFSTGSNEPRCCLIGIQTAQHPWLFLSCHRNTIWQKAVTIFIILHGDLSSQFFVLLFHLGLCLRAGEEQEKNGSIPAYGALQGQESGWLLPERSQRWRENPPLLIIYCSNWL